VCAAALELGFKTAHTVYIQRILEEAEVIADTPVFNDFELLYQHYPDAKFILIERDIASWLVSIKVLLTRMQTRLLVKHGGFFPSLKRCFGEVFSPLNQHTLNDDAHLTMCYERHQKRVKQFFSQINNPCLVINLAEPDSYQQLCDFLEKPAHSGFNRLNVNGKVTAWKQVKHPLKLESTRNGKADLK
jgi:hypothetical protein